MIDGKIHVAGGSPPGGSAFEVYDPATDKWEKLPDLPTQRNHLGGNSGTNAMPVYRPTMRCE